MTGTGGTPRVLVIKTGTTNPEVVETHGDYDDWFLRELTAAGARAEVLAPFAGAPLPERPDADGVLITGSPLSVRDEAPWMAELGRRALSWAEELPVLAICFGHQVVGEALGGRVEQNPAGGEYGTIAVDLTSDGARDPLFEGLPDTVEVQSTHRDALVVPPRGARRLAGTHNTPWQAFAAGPRLRAVQFHPEIRDDAMQRLLDVRSIEAPVRPTPHGSRILANWVRHWLRGGG